jgi:hypothetical protein
MVAQRRRNAVVELAGQARAILRLDDEAAVSVREHDCEDPGCGGTRTLILVLRAYHQTEAVSIDKPIEKVTRDDLEGALAPLGRRMKSAKARQQISRSSLKSR